MPRTHEELRQVSVGTVPIPWKGEGNPLSKRRSQADRRQIASASATNENWSREPLGEAGGSRWSHRHVCPGQAKQTNTGIIDYGSP